MSKNKQLETFYYELLYLVPNKYSEDELAVIINKVRKIINDCGGNITYSEEWGKKRLAYPIKHFRHGYYNLVEFDLAGEKIIKIDRALRLANEILRHQIIKKNKKIAEKVIIKQQEEKTKGAEKKMVEMKDLDKKLDKILEIDDLL